MVILNGHFPYMASLCGLLVMFLIILVYDLCKLDLGTDLVVLFVLLSLLTSQYNNNNNNNKHKVRKYLKSVLNLDHSLLYFLFCHYSYCVRGDRKTHLDVNFAFPLKAYRTYFSFPTLKIRFT